MADKYPLVSISEQETLIKTLISLLNTFPDLPETVKDKGILFYDMFPDIECLGMATAGSAVIFKKFIAGSYIGQYSFRLQYRYSTKNYSERISKQSLVSTISEWLQRGIITRPDGTTYQLENYPEISENKTIMSIEITDRTVLIDKNKTGYEDSITDLILKYHVKRVSN
jgi:hypothetical protein